MWLTIDSYIALHESGAAVLAPGHELDQLERARRLGSEAAALTAQAKHQVKRARRNVRRS